MANNTEFKFEILKEVAMINESPEPDGWDKVLTVISWNGGKPKLDIRSWNKDRTRMGKGISLSFDEFYEMTEKYKEVDLSKYEKV